MTFAEMQKEIQAVRFTGQELARISRWINSRYAAIWNAGDWNFKRAKPTPIYFTSGVAEAALPEDFGAAYAVYDCDGSRLPWLDPETFGGQFAKSGSGAATGFTVVDRRLYVAPKPSGDTWLMASYERRLSHFDGSGSPSLGPMDSDLDTPLWPEEHHYVLVLDATILGLQFENDPTWQELVPSRDELMDTMRDELTPSHQYARLQYGMYSG